MKKRFSSKLCCHMLAATGVLLLGGCNLGGFLNRAQIGFSEQAGVFVFNLLVGLVQDEDAGDLSIGGGGSMETKAIAER